MIKISMKSETQKQTLILMRKIFKPIPWSSFEYHISTIEELIDKEIKD